MSHVIRKWTSVETRLAAAEADVDELLADTLSLVHSMQRRLAALVCAEIHEPQKKPFATTCAFLRHFIDTDHYERLLENEVG
jgi:hypothetical protein